MSLLTEKMQAQDAVVILKKFQPAPFSGVLTTEEQFRFYVNTKDACQFTDKALDACHNTLASVDSGLISTPVLISFLLGLTVSYYVTH